jgi:hypothetical protein
MKIFIITFLLFVISSVTCIGLDSTYYNIDTTPPFVTIISPNPIIAPIITSSSSIVISGEAIDDLYLDSINWSTENGIKGICNGFSNWEALNVPLQIGDNLISITAEDIVGNIGTVSIAVIYQTATRDIIPPIINITSPTSNANYSTKSNSIIIKGIALDNIGISQINWSNNHGNSGVCTGTNFWQSGNIALRIGSNLITVTAKDTSGNIGIDILIVNRKNK